MNELAKYREQINDLLAKRMHVIRKVREEKQALALAEQHLHNTEEAREFCQIVAETVQKSAHTRIAGVVSKCLQAVFGDTAYEFQINFVQSRGKTEARLVFVRDEHTLENPEDEAGGGPVVVAALAAKLAVIRLSKPKLRPCLIMDEPFRDLSPKYRPMIPELIETLAKELGVQFIIATNEVAYRVGKVIEIGE